MARDKWVGQELLHEHRLQGQDERHMLQETNHLLDRHPWPVNGYRQQGGQGEQGRESERACRGKSERGSEGGNHADGRGSVTGRANEV